MPAISVEYEYRVHDGTTALATFFAGSGGALLVASSVAGGTNPWLTEPPAGDGTTIDPLTGKTRAGAWSVAIGDPITSGTDRLVTAVLEDATRGWRSRLTSRRAFVRERENGGAWVTTWVGFVSRVRYTSAAQVQITHTDSPARDKDAAAATQRPTETVSAYVTRWPTRACLAGGPIRGGWLFRPDPGGWDCVVESQSGGFTVFRVTGAYSAPSFQRRTVNLWAPIQSLNDAARPFFAGSALLGGSFPRLTVETFTPGVASTFSDPVVLASPIYVPTLPSGPGPVLGPTPQYHEPTLFCSQERITVAGTVGTVGQVRRLRVLALDPSAAFPVYTTAHPVTLVETLMIEQGLTVDTASRDSVRDLVGTAARVSVRIAAVRNFWRFAEEILAPYGVALRATAGGAVGFVAIRRTTSGLPTTTIALDDLAETDGAGIYEVAEQSVVARVAFSSVLYGLASPSDESGPADGIVAQPIRVEREAWDLGTEEAPRTLTLDADAMFHVDGQLESDAPRLGTAIAQDAFLRSRGGTVEIGELVVRRGTAPAALRVGDECLVNLPHLPHRNKRLGDDGSVPARVATVVRAQVEPAGVRLQLADAGSAAIDTGTAPTASVAQDVTFPRQCVALTVTNAATLNAGGRGVRVQVAVTSGAAPASTAYTDLVAYAPGAVPTTAERLGPFTPGQTVYLRLRAEQPGLRPGAWQTAISAALATLPAPSGVTVTWGTGSRTVGDLAWTNGDAAALVVVAIRRTADAAPGRTIDVLPAGSTRLRVWREVDADVLAAYGTSYTVEVSHLDPLTGQPSARATATVTPSDPGVAPTFPAPQLEIISPDGNPTAGTPNGIELAIATGATGEPMTVWRGATSVRANAVRIAVLDPDATTFRDYLPADNVTRHYWVEYLRAAVTGSSYAGSAVPGPLRDQAGAADSPRPTVSVVGGQLYRQTSTAFVSATTGGSIGGSGTAGRLARWATASTLGDSVIEDDGTHVFPTADATRDLGTALRRWRDVRASRDVIAGGTITVSNAGGGDALFATSSSALTGLRLTVGSQVWALRASTVSASITDVTNSRQLTTWHASGGISLLDATDPGAGVVRVAGALSVTGGSLRTYNANDGRWQLIGTAGDGSEGLWFGPDDAEDAFLGRIGKTVLGLWMGNAWRYRWTASEFRPETTGAIDLGLTGSRFRDGWFSRTVTATDFVLS